MVIITKIKIDFTITAETFFRGTTIITEKTNQTNLKNYGVSQLITA